MTERADAKKKSGTAVRRYKRAVKPVKENIGEHSRYPIEFMESTLVDLVNTHADVEATLESYRDLFDSDNDDDKEDVVKIDTELDTLQAELSDIKSQIAAIKLERTELDKNKVDTKTSKDTVPLKRFDPPRFSGNTRAYPAFLASYKTHVMSRYGEDPYALMQCLSDKAEKLVAPVQDDHNEMMLRLEQAYGNPEKQVDCILQQLKSIDRVQDGDQKNLVQMIETVETCWLDLKRLGLEAEMKTATMVSTIERALPNTQKREWTLQKPDHGDKFTGLLAYLVKEKAAVEYMNEEVRTDTSKVKPKVHCADISTEEYPSDTKNVLVNLLENQNQLMQMITKGFSKESAMKKPDSSSHFNSNQRFQCWFHKSNGHSIDDCTAFASASNDEKTSAIKGNGACFCCLKVGHISRNCSQKQQCGELDQNNLPCSRFHHKLLHGAHASGHVFHNAIHVVNMDLSGKRN